MILKINLCIYLFQWHFDEDLLYPWFKVSSKVYVYNQKCLALESRTGGNFAGEKMTKTMHLVAARVFF